MSKREKAKKALISLTETETDHVAGGTHGGGANNNGHAFGGAQGVPGNVKGQGFSQNDFNGRF